MAIVLPVGGGNVRVSAPAGATAFGVVGPFSANDVLDVMSVSANSFGATVFLVGASLGQSPDATLDTLNAGVPLIQRSNSVIGRTPSFEIFTTRDEVMTIEIFAGLIVNVGSSFLVVGLSVPGASAVALNASVRMVHVFREEPLEQGGSLQFPLRAFRFS